MTKPVEFKIGSRSVGEEYPPLIVAEIGINHSGSLSLAKLMVDEAALSGCECIKHQTHFVDDEMTDEARKIVPSHVSESIWDIIEACALSKDDEIELKKYVESKGMLYLSTPFSRSAADFLNEIGVPAFKIGSGECDNLPLVQHVASFGKPMIVSTGMRGIEDCFQTVDILRSTNVDFALLECTNTYPCKPEDISLKGISQLQDSFPDAVVGFSDHSIGEHISLAAVAVGARIIERHFTDSRHRKGPDVICSMDPVELRSLIIKSKDVFLASRFQKSRTPLEIDVYNFARGSVVADKDLVAGTELTRDNTWVRRPGNGDIPAKDYFQILGKKLVRSVKKNHQLKLTDFE
jgi:sialic acid synthase SpsE